MESRKNDIDEPICREGMQDTDTENRLVGTVGEREREKNGESSVNIYTLPCVKQIAGEKLLHNTGSPTWRSVTT